MNPVPMLSIGAIAVTGTFCALLLRRQTPELSLVLAVVTASLLLWKSWSALVTVIDLMDELAALAGLAPELLHPLYRTMGISILAHLSAALCRDGGLDSAGALVELAGSGAALVCAAPLIRGVMELLGSLL